MNVNNFMNQITNQQRFTQNQQFSQNQQMNQVSPQQQAAAPAHAQQPQQQQQQRDIYQNNLSGYQQTSQAQAGVQKQAFTNGNFMENNVKETHSSTKRDSIPQVSAQKPSVNT